MGGYTADEKLPTEHELAAEFQVSRPIIRDVLQLLRQKGLIYSRQGSGSYVRNNGYKPPLDFAPIVTRSDFQNYYALRIAIEPPATYAAAERLNETEIIQLSVHLRDIQTSLVSDRARKAAEQRFHSLITKASGNNFFFSILEATSKRLSIDSQFGRLFGQAQNADEECYYQEHEEIYHALRERDGTRRNASP